MAEDPDLDLAGTSWAVDEIAGATVHEGAPTLAFGADGRLTGHTGVNRLQATYDRDGDAITIGAPTCTTMAGPPPLMEQEHRFLDVLTSVTHAAGSSSMVVLTGTSDDGVEVSLRLVPAAPEEPAEEPEGAPTGAYLLRGAVGYRERIPLPEGARVTVTLDDVSQADAPSTTIAECSFEPAGQVPVVFEMPVAADALDDTSRTFGLRAWIEAGGELWWATDEHYAVDHTTIDDRHDLVLVSARGS